MDDVVRRDLHGRKLIERRFVLLVVVREGRKDLLVMRPIVREFVLVVLVGREQRWKKRRRWRWVSRATTAISCCSCEVDLVVLGCESLLLTKVLRRFVEELSESGGEMGVRKRIWRRGEGG